MSIHIPQTLLMTLQNTFDAEAKRVSRDVAKVLHVSEKDILEIVKKVPKVQFKIIDDSEIPTHCPVFMQGNKFLHRCRLPCILGTGRCIHHQKANLPTVPLDMKKLTRIKRNNEMDPELWCDEETQDIYDVDGTIVGQRTEDDSIELYNYEE